MHLLAIFVIAIAHQCSSVISEPDLDHQEQDIDAAVEIDRLTSTLACILSRYTGRLSAPGVAHPLFFPVPPGLELNYTDTTVNLRANERGATLTVESYVKRYFAVSSVTLPYSMAQ